MGTGAEFNARAAEYDAWYDSPAGRALFHMERDCLRPLLSGYSHPYLEIGVGSGRFAQALGVDYGVDPALNLLRLAQPWGIALARAVGERLPFPARVFGAVLIAFALCFVTDPAGVIQETRRVLRRGGGLVLGLILKESPWAQFYSEKGRQGHPLYSQARFHSKEEVESLLLASGFELRSYRSALFQPPGQNRYQYQAPLPAYIESAGFVGIEASAIGEAR